MKNTIGQNIAYFRKKSGMTQDELSEKMNVTAQAVSKWENDLSYPDLESIGRLAGIFGVTVDSIVNGPEAVPVVKLVETDNVERRILLISVYAKDEGAKVKLRFPVSLILKAYEDGNLRDIVGEQAGTVEGVIEMIRSGSVGSIVDVESEDADVSIEVVNYEGQN